MHLRNPNDNLNLYLFILYNSCFNSESKNQYIYTYIYFFCVGQIQKYKPYQLSLKK